MVRCLTAPYGEIWGRCDVFDPMAHRPRDRTVRARAKELTWDDKRVAANGLTIHTKKTIPTIKDVPRRT